MPNYGSSHCRNSKNSRIAFGTLIILIGVLILSKRLGLFILPFHVWPLILIAIGIYTGVKHQFRNFGSWALIALGVLFAVPKFWVLGVVSTHLVAPVILVLLGIYLIVTPRSHRWSRRNAMASTIENDVINLDATFGERTSVITSKSFKGGVVNNTFGSSKINLLQADSTEPIILDMKVSFGTVEVIVPSHWDIEFDINNSFASVEDKRYMRTTAGEEKRTLRMTGSCSFGSIMVKSV
jgi:predicted membrane protein